MGGHLGGLVGAMGTKGGVLPCGCSDGLNLVYAVISI